MSKSFLGKRSWHKKLAVAVTAGLMAGVYLPAEGAQAAEYNASLTGDASYDTAYGEVLNNGVYTFNEDTTISVGIDNDFAGAIYIYNERNKVHTGENQLDPVNDVTIDAGDNTLNLYLNGKTVSDNLSAIGAGIWLQADGDGVDGLKLTINADKVNVTAEGVGHRADAIHVVGGTTGGEASKLIINGDINIIAKGVGRAEGIYAVGNAQVTINGNLSMRDENGSYGVAGKHGNFDTGGLSENATDGPFLSVSGIYTGPDNAYGGAGGTTVNVNGDVDLAVDSSAVVLNGTGTINLNGGGTIEVSDGSNGNTYRNYAVRNNGGTFTFNVDSSGNVLDEDKDVVIKGNIWNNGTTKIALTTGGSLLDGIAHNDGTRSDLTLYLQNGATWINESWGAESTNRQYNISQVNNFIGGTDWDSAGYIAQKDENTLYLDGYSGYSVIMYNHVNDGDEVTDYTAGDTYIQNAAEGSAVRLVTNAQGAMDLSTQTTIEKVLSALAQKLYYSDAGKSNNLKGEVAIASGLTNSSALYAWGDMGFDADNEGKGYYDGNYQANEDIGQSRTEFTTTIGGEDITEYKAGGVLQNDGTYIFNKDSFINVNGKEAAIVTGGKDLIIDATLSKLTVNAQNGSGNYVWGINNANGNLNIITDELNLNVEGGSKRVDAISVSASADNTANLTVDGNTKIDVTGNSAQGVYVYGNSAATFNGDLSITLDGNNSGWQYYGASGLYGSGLMGITNAGATIDVNGKYSFNGSGNGVFANTGATKVNLNGDVDITVNDTANKNYAAVNAQNATVNINVKEGKAAGNTVKIKGNIVADTGAVNANDKLGTETVINIGLGNKESSLEGIVYNMFPDEGKTAGGQTYTGTVNMYLNNGASWTNQVFGSVGNAFTGSHITNFVGGTNSESYGSIYQNDSNDLTIDNYTGYTNIYYTHENGGINVSDYTAGDVKINNATGDSQVTVITDSTGITATDKEQVAQVLDSLAQKLYYAPANNDSLIGKVAIASGLTSSYIALGNIDFSQNEDGKGSYLPYKEQGKTIFTTGITGVTDDDTAYSDVIQLNKNYKFTKDTTIAVDSGSAIAFSNSSTKDNTIIDASGQKLTLTSSGTTEGIIYAINTSKSLSVSADEIDVEINKNAKNAIVMQSSNWNGRYDKLMLFNGDVNISGDLGDEAVKGIVTLYGQGTMTFKDDLSIKDLKNVKGEQNYDNSSAIYIRNRGTDYCKGDVIFNVNGNVDIEIDGTGINVEAPELTSSKGIYDVTANIAGGSIKTNKDNSAENYALRASNGTTINMNVDTNMMDENGDALVATNNDVVLNGNIGVIEGYYSGYVGWNKVTIEADSVVNLGLTTKDSSWNGALYKANTHDLARFNLWLQNGATWTNEVYGGINSGFTGSSVNNFVGGDTAAQAGWIYQKDSNDLTIDNYSGYTNIMYAHNNDGTSVDDYTAGNTIVNNATNGSHITLVTDTTGGIDVNDQGKVEGVFDVLAQKLYYTAAGSNTNLSGAVALASGLTSSSAFQALGDITFDSANKGQGSYTEGSYTTDIEGNKPGGDETDPELPSYDYGSDTTITGSYRYDKDIFNQDGDNVTNGASVVYDLTGNRTLDIEIERESNVEINVADGAGTLTLGGTDSGLVVGSGSDVVINGNLDITANGPIDGQNMPVSGITTDGHSGTSDTGCNDGEEVHLTINGNVTMRSDDTENPWGITGQLNGGQAGYSGARWESTGIKLNNGNGSYITITGDVDLAVKGTAVSTEPYYKSESYGDNTIDASVINLNGGNVNIETPEDDSYAYYSLASYGGTINVNATNDGVVDESNVVTVKGNVIATRMDDDAWDVSQGGDFFFQTGRINMALANEDSYWYGVVDNCSKEQTGEVNLTLANGGTWYHQNMSQTNGMSVETMPEPSSNVYGEYDGVSYINKLTGGNSEESAGYIYAVDEADIEIDVYKGYTSVFYEHLNDGDEASDYTAGDITINHAVSGSGITLVTDSSGIIAGSEESYYGTMDALAGKLIYKGWTEGEDGLIAQVKVASGLTSASAEASGYIAYDDSTGEGYFVYDKPENITGENGYNDDGEGEEPGGNEPGEGGDITYGDYESPIMQGVRSAMMTSMIAWRDNAADITNRGAMLRNGSEEGVWARTFGGKAIYNGNNTNIQNSYWAGQVGYDRMMKHGWRVGAMVDYQDGDANYLLGGKGDNKLYSIGAYASKELGNNDYIDIGIKFGKVENDYTVYNEYGRELTGSYDARAYSISAQYAKRFGDKAGYWEPQVQLTWAHIEDANDTATSNGDTMRINQEAFDSLVGRIGIETGKYTDRSALYARLSLAHEFAGDVDGSYYAADGGLKSTSYDLGGTWSELTIGGAHKISKDCDIYADFTRGLSGDYEHQWKVNAGLRFTF